MAEGSKLPLAMTISELFEQFKTERRYLQNVSPKTLEWYTYSFKPFRGCLEGVPLAPDSIKSALKRGVANLASSTLQPTSINDYIRALNAFFRWCHTEGHLSELIKLGYLKEERKIIQTLSPQQVKALLAWKPRTFAERRLHALVATLLDCGLRIQEALELGRERVDLENLMVTVKGKGEKHRIVPISFELRRVLYRWLSKHRFGLVFPTFQGREQNQRNMLRDLKGLGRRLRITGVRVSFHTFRHTFAVSYLRAGGNLFYLSRILGHSN
jgi:integrase/recombinase XerD